MILPQKYFKQYVKQVQRYRKGFIYTMDRQQCETNIRDNVYNFLNSVAR